MWAVKRIIGKRTTAEEGLQYQVLWDTQVEDISWESMANLESCKASIKEYEDRAKKKRKRDGPTGKQKACILASLYAKTRKTFAN